MRAARIIGLWLEQPGFYLNRCLTLISFAWRAPRRAAASRQQGLTTFARRCLARCRRVAAPRAKRAARLLPAAAGCCRLLPAAAATSGKTTLGKIAARVTAWRRARAVRAKCSFAGLKRFSKILYAAPTLPFANLRVEQIKCRHVKSVLSVMKPLWN